MREVYFREITFEKIIEITWLKKIKHSSLIGNEKYEHTVAGHPKY